MHSLDQAVAAVREAGALVRSAPTLTEAGPRAVVEDPDGRAVELEQGGENDAAPATSVVDARSGSARCKPSQTTAAHGANDERPARQWFTPG